MNVELLDMNVELLDMNDRELYELGLHGSDEEWEYYQVWSNPPGVTGLVSESQYLYLIGLNWKDERYNNDILESIIKSKDASLLYAVGRDFKNDRFSPAIGHALYETGNQEFISLAFEEWSKSRLMHISKKKVVVCY